MRLLARLASVLLRWGTVIPYKLRRRCDRCGKPVGSSRILIQNRDGIGYLQYHHYCFGWVIREIERRDRAVYLAALAANDAMAKTCCSKVSRRRNPGDGQ